MENYEINDMIFDFVYSCAMGDSTRQTSIRAGSKKRFLDYNEEPSKKAKDIVRSYIDAGIMGINNDFYAVANDVVGQLSSIDSEFTFGNSQKLINMTAKYLYIKAYNTNNNEMIMNYTMFHCPMDHKMICEVTKAYKKFLVNNSVDVKQDDTIRIVINGKETTDWNKVAWSNLGSNKVEIDNDILIYKKYQTMVSFFAGREGLSPLEFDYKYWNKHIE